MVVGPHPHDLYLAPYGARRWFAATIHVVQRHHRGAPHHTTYTRRLRRAAMVCGYPPRRVAAPSWGSTSHDIYSAPAARGDGCGYDPRRAAPPSWGSTSHDIYSATAARGDGCGYDPRRAAARSWRSIPTTCDLAPCAFSRRFSQSWLQRGREFRTARCRLRLPFRAHRCVCHPARRGSPPRHQCLPGVRRCRP
jgi:hypothetical protein